MVLGWKPRTYFPQGWNSFESLLVNEVFFFETDFSSKFRESREVNDATHQFKRFLLFLIIKTLLLSFTDAVNDADYVVLFRSNVCAYTSNYIEIPTGACFPLAGYILGNPFEALSIVTSNNLSIPSFYADPHCDSLIVSSKVFSDQLACPIPTQPTSYHCVSKYLTIGSPVAQGFYSLACHNSTALIAP